MGTPFDAEDDAPGALLAAQAAGDNAPALTITELSQRLKRTVEDRFGFVRVRGELSGVKRAASGHLYCSLKDDAARLDGVMWRGSMARLGFQPADGIEVIATGKLTTYPGRSNYQIVIERMEIAGEGALLALLEKTRARLAAEGLFDAARKRPLPSLPRVIGVVTSPTGAVIRDILHRLRDRFPSHVVVWPVLVQGQGAAAQVAAAVRGFSELPADGPVPRPDLVIVARGGGSIEDLWAFNEEVVVRAIATSTIPVISAVGHETDTTLADHAADRRAPTPTAAAEMAVPVRADLAASLAELDARRRRAVARLLGQARERLDQRARRLPQPQALLNAQAQRLDDWAERLRRSLGHRTQLAAGALSAQALRLRPALLEIRLRRERERLAALRLRPEMMITRIAQARERLDQRAQRLPQAQALLTAPTQRLDDLAERLGRSLGHRTQLAAGALSAQALRLRPEVVLTRIAQARKTVDQLDRLRRSLDPEAPLQRGYVLVTDGTGALVKTRAAALVAGDLVVKFADGPLGVVPAGDGAPPRPRARPDRPAAPPAAQPKLL